jgi:methionine-gamma-lyase
LSALAGVCKRYGVKTIIDNTLPTPIFQRPFNHGIDFIIHSTTKYLNGHGNAIGGAIVGCDIDFMKDKVWERMKLLGTNPSPFDVWLLHNGMKTLHIRMKAQEKHAFALATHLLSEPKINAVHYLGLKTHAHHDVAAKQMYGYGALLSMDINGGTQGAIDFMNALQICSLTPTLGDVDTLILHPATSSHLKVSAKIRANNGITDGLIRMSVGIEDVDDLIADVHQALMST